MSAICRRRFLAAVAAAPGLSGCGTILFPERRGQPAGRLDWAVVALDGIGLLFFFVPGVIAFAVDFATGAIYLPPTGYTNSRQQRPQLVTHHIPRGDLNATGLARTVSNHLQRPFRLSPGSYETRPMESLDEFWSVNGEFEASFS